MKKTIITDIKVVLEPPYWIGYAVSEERRFREYQRWAEELEEFIRDHRSQDPVSISVEKETLDICSFCGYAWEVDKDGYPLCCEKAMNEWENGQDNHS